MVNVLHFMENKGTLCYYAFMKIYTRTGDAGETSLYGGERRSKADVRIQAYGEVDEMQAVLGVVKSFLGKKGALAKVESVLDLIQNDAFTLCCELARTTTKPGRKDPVLQAERVVWLEKQIDQFEADLPTLQAFIMQGGSQAGSFLHLARAVCRRAERVLTQLRKEEEVSDICGRYLNRLSDLLFVLARWVNLKQGEVEMQWRKP